MRIRHIILYGFMLLTATAPAIAADLNTGEKELFNSINHRRQLSKGAILIAGRNLNDLNFSRSVVLITEYNELGTTGLIINRPLNMAAKKVFPQINQITPEAGNLFVGGPVGVNNLQILVETGEQLLQNESLTGDLYLINNPRSFNSLTKHEDSDMKLRIYVGYAGWGAGQLESEIIRGDWHIWRVDSEMIFSEQPEHLWLELIELVTVQWAGYN